jgi:hypothetical protein
MEYLIPLLDRTAAAGGGGGIGGSEAHLLHAFNACALASLGNRTSSSSSVASAAPPLSSGKMGSGLGRMPGLEAVAAAAAGGQRGGVLGKAFAEYSKALRATQAALVDPERWKGDGVLAAVLLLGMFEVSPFLFCFY